MADVEAGYNEVRANKARQAERRLIGRLDGGGGVCALPAVLARRHCPGGRRAAEPPLRRTKASNYGQHAATRATQWPRSRGEIESPAHPPLLPSCQPLCALSRPCPRLFFPLPFFQSLGLQIVAPR